MAARGRGPIACAVLVAGVLCSGITQGEAEHAQLPRDLDYITATPQGM